MFKRSNSAHIYVMSAFLLGLVSRDGGENAFQEWYESEKCNLWKSEQHNSEQQLCTGQREVWYTLTNWPHVSLRPQTCYTRLFRRTTIYVFTVYLLCVCWPLSSPDGSYTEEQNSETQVKANINPTPNPNPNPIPTLTTPEFDDEFDDEETLPTIGTCKALYPFEGKNGKLACCLGVWVLLETEWKNMRLQKWIEVQSSNTSVSLVHIFKTGHHQRGEK